MSEELIYHVCDGAAWRAAIGRGPYGGSADDRRDGYMHFSTRAQVRASTALHRAGQRGLMLLAVAVDRLGSDLKWEPSRGGQLFPHLYGELPADAVMEATDLPLDDDGTHRFPGGFPAPEEGSR
jgi:uncharacterized protein (DUF952 family)